MVPPVGHRAQSAGCHFGSGFRNVASLLGEGRGSIVSQSAPPPPPAGQTELGEVGVVRDKGQEDQGSIGSLALKGPGWEFIICSSS